MADFLPQKQPKDYLIVRMLSNALIQTKKAQPMAQVTDWD